MIFEKEAMISAQIAKISQLEATVTKLDRIRLPIKITVDEIETTHKCCDQFAGL